MWRVDGPFDDAELGSEDIEPQLVTGSVSYADTLIFTDPDLQVFNEAQPERDRWLQEIAGLGGKSPLVFFNDHELSRIELSVTHPGGLAQFLTGKPTRLSSLIRDNLALKQAYAAASKILNKSIELIAARGIESVYLAVGLAEWKYNEVDHRAPILLQPLMIRAYGRDYQLKLKNQPILNPALQRQLLEQFQINLDSEAFVELAKLQGVFKPQPVIDRLRGITSHLSYFSVQPRLLISNFAEVAPALVEECKDLDNNLLDALAGNEHAKQLIRESIKAVDVVDPDTVLPESNHALLDSDAEQDLVLNQILAGNSLTVRALPGTGVTQTVVNALGVLAKANKRVLVVSPRRLSLDAIRQRFAELKLPGLALSTRHLSQDLIQAISRSERAVRPRGSEISSALTRLRTVLKDHREALHRVDPEFRVNVLDCLDELARLSESKAEPETTVRLSKDSVQLISENRRAAVELLQNTLRLNALVQGDEDSPWFQAKFSSPEAADASYSAAKRVAAKLPELFELADRVAVEAGFKSARSMTELTTQISLLLALREILDRFTPDIFDRPLTELISAAAGRSERSSMSSSDRKKLIRLAKEYLRPGARYENMHEQLVEIQRQRTIWQRFAIPGTEPTVPTGLLAAADYTAEIESDLDLIEGPLNLHSEHGGISDMTFDELKVLIQQLAKDNSVLEHVEERAELRSQIELLGLGELSQDLTKRKVAEDKVSAELELAWWQSVLEILLAQNPELLNGNTEILAQLEADFNLVDEVQVSGGAERLAWTLAEQWRVAVVDYPQEAEALRRMLLDKSVSAKKLQQKVPVLSKILSPVWLTSLYQLPELAPQQKFDAVFILDAAAISLAEAIPALLRARQVVAFGDPVSQIPQSFELSTVSAGTEISSNPELVSQVLSEAASVAELEKNSAFARLAELFPEAELSQSYRIGGEDLVDLISQKFYDSKIKSTPWAGQFLGHRSVVVEYVPEGSGLPDPDSGLVDSPDAEVIRVLKLVVAHAEFNPEQSLMVVTASAKHARRIERAVLKIAANRASLSKFLLDDRVEPFSVFTAEQAYAQTRDRVIFSIGYGRTPHDRLLSEFGSLSRPGGDRVLAMILSSARRHLSLVTSFLPEHIDESRMAKGVTSLAKILAEASELDPESSTAPPVADELIKDLARRLEANGVRVEFNYRDKLPLVANLGGRALVIETDRNLSQYSLREALRLRPQALNRLGWHYLRVNSFELFSEPDTVLAKAMNLLGGSNKQNSAELESSAESLAS